MNVKPIAVYYEHPDWFQPLFAELARQNIDCVKIYAPDHFHDPADRDPPYSLVVNRVSAYPSGGSHPEIVFYVKDINPLSNFVANAPEIVGFDPWPRFVDFMLERAAG